MAKMKVDDWNKLTQTFMLKESLKVAGNVIHDITILGEKSLNGPVYTEKYMEGSIPMYEGAVVNVDHRKGKESRGIADRLGLIEGVYHDKKAKKLKAKTLTINPKHALAEQVLWAAEFQPTTMGMSHDVLASGSRNDDGDFLAESCHKVICVDLVADPATTKSLFESIQEARNEQEGVIGDTIRNRNARNRLHELTREGIRELRSIMFPEDFVRRSEVLQLTPQQERDNLLAVVDDLRLELVQFQPTNRSPLGEAIGDLEMKLDELSLASLKESNKEVYDKILVEAKESLDTKSKEDRIVSLEAQLKEAKEKLDTIAKTEKAKALCAQKGLTEDHVNDIFMGQLKACKDEASMVILIEDRVSLAGGNPVKSARRDVPANNSNKTVDNVKESKSVADLSTDDFISQLSI